MKPATRTPPFLKVGHFTFVPSIRRTLEGLLEYDGNYAVHGRRRVTRDVIEKFARDVCVSMIELRP